MSYKLSFYYTQDWQVISSFIRSIYPKKCMKCNKKNTEFHVDHIIPRSIKPDLELDFRNLQVLCKDCNLEKSNKESIDYRSDRDKEMLARNMPYAPVLNRDKTIELQEWIDYNSEYLTYNEIEKLVYILKHFEVYVENNLNIKYTQTLPTNC